MRIARRVGVRLQGRKGHKELVMSDKHLTLEEATAFFSELYYGEHHIPGYKVHEFGHGFCVKHSHGGLATFDSNYLTRLVLMAHDKCIRVDVSPISFCYLRIAIWKRQNRDGNWSEKHPTIETALKEFRS